MPMNPLGGGRPAFQENPTPKKQFNSGSTLPPNPYRGGTRQTAFGAVPVSSTTTPSAGKAPMKKMKAS